MNIPILADLPTVTTHTWSVLSDEPSGTHRFVHSETARVVEVKDSELKAFHDRFLPDTQMYQDNFRNWLDRKSNTQTDPANTARRGGEPGGTWTEVPTTGEKRQYRNDTSGEIIEVTGEEVKEFEASFPYNSALWGGSLKNWLEAKGR